MKPGLLQKVKEAQLFFSHALTTYKDMGMLFPSSVHVAEKIADLLPLESMVKIFEIGAGTGSLTRALLKKMNSDSKLICIEKTPAFCRYLKNMIDDSRLSVTESPAENVLNDFPQLADSSADCVVLSLPAKLVSPQTREKWAELSWALLKPGGLLVVQQCVPVMEAHLRHPKWSFQSRKWIFNLPPFRADIFTRHS